MKCLFQIIHQFFVLTLHFLLGFILAPSVIIVEIVLRCNKFFFVKTLLNN
jgi:hypothetical protein